MKTIKTNLVIKFKEHSGILREIHCRIDLKNKYNVITGDSATGKTVLEDTMEHAIAIGGAYNNIVDCNGNKWYYCTSMNGLTASRNEEIILCTEQVSRVINATMFIPDAEARNELKDYFKRSTAKHIFINRGMRAFTLDYESIFKIQNKHDINEVVRLFNDYTEFKRSNYFITECINHHGITPTIAKRHNIDFNDEEACKALTEKLSL